MVYIQRWTKATETKIDLTKTQIKSIFVSGRIIQKILNEILRMINKEINNKIIIDSKKQNISVMVRNRNSLKNYTKRAFLIEQLLINNIQIAIIQQTMLNEYHKMYIKVYKICRSNFIDNRKGVAILISNELDCKSYEINSPTTGR